MNIQHGTNEEIKWKTISVVYFNSLFHSISQLSKQWFIYEHLVPHNFCLTRFSVYLPVFPSILISVFTMSISNWFDLFVYINFQLLYYLSHLFRFSLISSVISIYSNIFIIHSFLLYITVFFQFHDFPIFSEYITFHFIHSFKES